MHHCSEAAVAGTQRVKNRGPRCFRRAAGAPSLGTGRWLTLQQLLQESDIRRSLNILVILLPSRLLDAVSFLGMSCPNWLTWKTSVCPPAVQRAAFHSTASRPRHTCQLPEGQNGSSSSSRSQSIPLLLRYVAFRK